MDKGSSLQSGRINAEYLGEHHACEAYIKPTITGIREHRAWFIERNQRIVWSRDNDENGVRDGGLAWIDIVGYRRRNQYETSDTGDVNSDDDELQSSGDVCNQYQWTVPELETIATLNDYFAIGLNDNESGAIERALATVQLANRRNQIDELRLLVDAIGDAGTEGVE